MVSPEYRRLPNSDSSDHGSPAPTPSSPPPSFRSRTSSPASLSRRTSHVSRLQNADVDQTLADAFHEEGGSGSEDEIVDDDRERLMRAMALRYPRSQQRIVRPDGRPQRVIEGSTFTTPSVASRRGLPTSSNDGVFANLNAKPEPGEKLEDQPPSYEQAAADATPPYWETTILAPGIGTDEVYIDGLPVGSVFSFLWNGVISMVFQLVGFLLTYLLHTTHAAKNGSRAGLGITIISFGYNMRAMPLTTGDNSRYGVPPDPNSHDFDPASVSDAATAAAVASQAHPHPHASLSSNWLAYLLMVVGWFILVKAVVDYIKARKHEQLVLQSPGRGLHIAVVGEGEGTDQVV